MDDKAKQFGEAIKKLLDAIVVHESRLERGAPAKAYRLDEYRQAAEAGEFFLADPIGYGLRKAIRKAGEYIATQFDMAALQDVAEYAATVAGDEDGDSYGRRANIIDKQWDGIRDASGAVWIA